LRQLGLEESWVKQAVDAQWREVVQRKIMQAEEQRWRRGVLSNARLELYSTWKLRLSPTSEEYLGEREKNRRRLWTKLRAGCLELRVETGRWERLTVAGVQRMAPRWARLCPLCFLEVEDAEHTLLRCSAYDHLRKPFLLGSGLTGGLERAAAEVLSGRRGREKELWSWMMSSAGVQRGMLFLEKVMKERTVVLG